MKDLFENPLTMHVVIAVKGLLRRANLIANKWKLRIGATHELCTKTTDTSVQVQGLPGRMTGYWRSDIEGGHKTGPYRTSIKAIEEYEKTYDDPFGTASTYTAAGFKKKKNGEVKAVPTFMTPSNIKNLIAVDLPEFIEPRHICSMRINIITLIGNDLKITKNKFLDFLKNSYPDYYAMYFPEYTLQYWNVDSEDKIQKYCINAMRLPNAYSSPTNITLKNKKKKNIFVYRYKNELILSPWNGSISI
jgi:hypothetical protein